MKHLPILTLLSWLLLVSAPSMAAPALNSPVQTALPATAAWPNSRPPLFGFDSGYPGPLPGQAMIRSEAERITVSNAALSMTWTLTRDGLRLSSLRDEHSKRALTLTGEVFQIVLANGERYLASRMAPENKPQVRELTPSPRAARLAARILGRTVEVPLRSADGRIRVLWRALAHENANYFRQEIEISTRSADTVLKEIVWMDGTMPEARTVGRVDGSPIISGNFFLGAEDPHALNLVESSGRELGSGKKGETGGRISCRLRRDTALHPGETLTSSFVLGIAPPGQMRRAFLYYLERERAHPYRPFLHYNSWYDTAWTPFALNETNCLEAIRLFGERFLRPHGVVMDTMVFDDGWDDPKTLWQFHQGFPKGFAPLAKLSREYGTRLGVWLSPFGGYGEPKKQRLKFGHQQGYETNATGFSLAGTKYYTAFKEACVGMIRNYAVNHFKFDGIATGMYANGGAEYIRDTEAMRRLMLELRQEDPNLYINLTTGSWPSPFWLRYTDSLWRQGGDMGLAGKGPKQQQWLTYRDQEVYRNVVSKGPLFPLNSLMTQGVAYSRQGSAGEPTFNSAGFKDDVRAFFGGGTGLQELYIQPAKLTEQDWKVLAEAAQWSRANADVLVDTHWIGGDPSKHEVYGYASWSPRQGIVMLRNPDDQTHEFRLDAGQAFELPAGAPTQFALKSPWAEDASKSALTAEARKPVAVTLKPFEVAVMTAQPIANPAAASSDPSQVLSTALIPQPVWLKVKPGQFRFAEKTRIVARGPAAAEGEKLAGWLRSATKLSLPLSPDAVSKDALVLEHLPALEAELGSEGYRLTITPERVLIQAAADAGLFYGGVTLRQLLPVEAFCSKPAGGSGTGWTAPCVEIEDYPRFGWRGLLLDVARHYMPVEFLKKFIDLAALHKFNSLQLHLTDDQGWRIEIKQYPRLTQVGSVRQESPRKGNRKLSDATPYGPFFYRQDQIRELVEFARKRHVTLVPEIEMPGHFVGALAAYPHLSCTGGPFEVRTRWGIEADVLCPGNDEAIQFALNVLAEVTDLFPSRFIHIGGDEAPRDRWKKCPKCQARMRTEGLQNEAQLQTYLNRRVEQFLGSRGRRLIGWDEILEGGLTPDAVVMSWRGMEGGIAAANAGHDVVMSPTSHCYFDYAQSRDAGEPEAIGGFIPLETVYNFEPLPPALPEAKRKHILGAQGNLWTEYMWTPQDVEYFAFPRATALAEVAWTPATQRNFADFSRRLERHLPRLDCLDVKYRPGLKPAPSGVPAP